MYLVISASSRLDASGLRQKVTLKDDLERGEIFLTCCTRDDDMRVLGNFSSDIFFISPHCRIVEDNASVRNQ